MTTFSASLRNFMARHWTEEGQVLGMSLVSPDESGEW